MNSLKAHFLIAAPRLFDSNFFKSVILMVQHTDHGALGLTLNRPLETMLKAAWNQVSESPCEIDEPLYQGGPVEGPLMVVHTNPAFSDMEVLPGLYFSTEREAIEQLVNHNNCPMRFFVGYAGWAPGQLDAEMEAGGWLAIPAAADYVFLPESDALWDTLHNAISRAAFSGMNPKVVPEDPSTN